ncbi:aldose 1-epimerase family protein [Mycolicibacterium frederiksbergense]|uniref:Aldose epimerase n=1 Tax=Mycolicibacterium frederiksbergense TaxID=117567 RepID=A0A6H0S057_9MYCO|nr:aldose 1-epimerase family protein [Mycolicibacterium frederiksbergense]QIV80580.1 aldose epimerase [Mycolicibacterium frederiksbergense]
MAPFELVLHSGGRTVRAAIAEAGAAIRQLSVDGVEITAEFDDRGPVPFFCGAVLIPWPNRVRDGRWVHHGRTHQLDINDARHGSALHGLVHHTAHRVVARSASSITLGASVLPQRGYPFRLRTEVTYHLVADGLTATHTVRNIGSDCAPVAIGAHPFLTIGDVPTETLALTVNGSHHIDVDDRLIPTGCTAVPGTAWDLRGGRVIADLDLDDAWSVPTSDGRSVHTLCSPDGRTVSLWADDSFGFVHVFITRQFPRGEQFVTAVALEPMTAPADAFNSGVGLRWLAPDETLSASWGIGYDDARYSRR